MGEYKKQHTITKAYLKQFTATETPNTLWRFAKADGSRERCNFENATVKFYAYSFQEEDGKWNHTVEHLFSEIEYKAIPLLEKLKSGSTLSQTEKDGVATFISTIVRRPAALLDHFQKTFLEYRNAPERIQAFIDEMLPKLRQRYSDAEIEGLREKVRRGQFDVSVDRAKAGHLQAWLDGLPNSSTIIASMHWQVWLTRGSHPFITSDAPAYVRRHGRYDDPGIVGIARDDLKAELHFPISPTCFLIAKHDPCKYENYATKTRVDELNKLTIRMAYAHIFAQNDSRRIQTMVAANGHFVAPLPDLRSLQTRIDEKHLGKVIAKPSARSRGKRFSPLRKREHRRK
jgi:hypothetical protein